MTGYDLVRYFDDSVGYVWSAPQSQIYPELRRMERAGLVRATVTKRGPRAQKRVYAITVAGEKHLREWVRTSHDYGPDRDAFRLKAVFFDLASFEDVRKHLIGHEAYFERRSAQWSERAEALRALNTPLLKRRLEKRPTEEHDAIALFKAHAFDGQTRRAQAEIDWAREGLRLVDRIEARRQAAKVRRGTRRKVERRGSRTHS